MSELEKIKKKRAVIRQLMTKLALKIESYLTEANVSEQSIGDLHDWKSQLLDRKETLKLLDAEIESLLENDDEYETEIVQSLDYRDRAISCIGKLDRFLTKSEIIRSAPLVINNTENSIPRNENTNLEAGSSYGTNFVKLPKLEICKFYGDASKWLDFYNSFEIAIHNNNCLSKIEKFNYLKMYLGGNALSAVSGFSLTEENYDSCISLLKDRFGRQDLVISSHMNKLLAIESVKNSSNVKALRRLYDEFEINIRSLKTLKVTAGSYGNLLCPVVLQKLPEDLNLEYNRKRESNSEFDIEELITFIRKEVECREASQVLNNSKNFSSSRDVQIRGKSDFDNKNIYHRKVQSSSSLVTSSNKIFCIFCNNNTHESKDCFLNIDKRKAALKNQFRCFRCLKKNHVSKKCWSKFSCKLCNKPHNDLICENLILKEKNLENQDATTYVSASCVSNQKRNKPVLLHTALAILKSSKKEKLVRVLYDSGSERTFVKRSTCKNLNLDAIKTERLHIYGFGSEESKQSCYDLTELQLQNRNDVSVGIKLDALVVDKITQGNISAPAEYVKRVAMGKNISLSDTGEVADIDILIGADYLFDVLFDKSVRLNKTLVATDSLFGYVVQGRYSNECNDKCFSVNHTVLFNVIDNANLFWDLEGLGLNVNNDDIDSENMLLKTFRSNLEIENCKYKVKLLWKPDIKHMLRDNFRLASERFNRLRSRFKKDSAFFKEYRDIIKEYESEGIIEQVHKTDEDSVKFYLPHRAVIRNDKATSKVRIVFDASSHAEKELSLNDCLYTGPNLYPDLFQLLLSFRENPVAFTADLKQAFLQIKLHEEDRDVTRFFWSNDPFEESSTIIYRFCRVLFGINCSPFLLTATIKEHIKKHAEKYPATFNLLNRNVYVDDVIGGCADTNSAFQTSLECIEIFRDAGMLLRKFQTNDIELRELWEKSGIIPGQEENQSIGQAAFPFKVLGVCWDPNADFLYFECQNLLEAIGSQSYTKRQMLKIIGRIFDPVGFLGPFTLLMKCLIQTVWERKLEWDETLPTDLELKWREICKNLNELSELKIPRYYFYEISSKNIVKYELHLFSDASLKGYGTVAYLRVVASNGMIRTSFVASKGRVAPLKRLTLPRLELLGALLSSRLSVNILRSLKFTTTPYFWCDSSIVCCWVKTPAIHLKQFVRNRVTEIQSLTEPENWFYCPGKDNPADLISRGTSLTVLKNSQFWWKGPAWLQQSKEMWPVKEPMKVDDEEMEYKNTVLVTENVAAEDKKILDFCSYSRLSRVLRIVAWIKRFLNGCKKRRSESNTLTSSELQDAEYTCIKLVQREYYQNELQSLQNGKSVPASSIYKLSPFLDDKGILRIKGRLEECDYNFDEKKPIILPKQSKFTELLVKQEHENMLHSGIESTLARVRTRYWIPKGRQLIRKIIFQCLICRRHTAKPADQMTGQIPKERISETPAFTVCGLDFTGPVYVKLEENIVKSYIALFTCAVTRAVHLELVTDMSTPKFLLAFRRFLSRRGTCHTIFSDNAKSFKSANKELHRLFDIIENSEFKNFIASKRISWRFIVERAPWWGGFYERLMRTIKDPLKKILRKALFSYEEMTTVLSEIETVINLRPLTYVSNEVGEPEPLTPAHFLQFGKKDIEYPPHFIESLHKTSTREALTKRRQYQTTLLTHLWKRWKEQYLLNLRSAHKLNSPSPQKCLKEGDIVLVEDTKKSKFLWDLGAIVSVFKGRDGLVRSCNVKTSKGQYKRPVQLLYPLELYEHFE